jgi:hypothetical protein
MCVWMRYNFFLCGYPNNMVADMVCYYPMDMDYPLADYPTSSIRIIRSTHVPTLGSDVVGLSVSSSC